jgi:hypothetical protein
MIMICPSFRIAYNLQIYTSVLILYAIAFSRLLCFLKIDLYVQAACERVITEGFEIRDLNDKLLHDVLKDTQSWLKPLTQNLTRI